MEPNSIIARTIGQLNQVRQEIMTLPAEKALDRILSAPEPAALVHTFPEQDLHLLVHDIGLDDAGPLLKLASTRQWEYFFDVEVWDRDRIDLGAVTRWAQLLLSVDPTRMIQWASHEKIELLEYYLFKNIQVVVRDHDQDPSELGDHFFSLDGVFYIRFLNDAIDQAEKEEALAPEGEDLRNQLLTDLLKRLADADLVRYHQILLEAMHIIPSESEEDLYWRRNTRMAEKGFLPLDEAIGIYHPLKIEEVENRSAQRREYRPAVVSRQPVTRFTARLEGEKNPVIRAFEAFDTDEHRLRAEMELAGLVNRLIVADQKQIRDRGDLEAAVQKACGYILIGITALAAKAGHSGPDSIPPAVMMVHYSLPSLFQLGFGYALRLKWQADKWYRQSWCQQQGLALTFWDEAWMGALGGLLLKKPLHFDASRGDRHYREFASMTEITQTETVLGQVIAMDRFLGRMRFDLRQRPNLFLTYKNLLLTTWARACLGLSEEMAPIDLSRFQSFFADQLFESPDNKNPETPAMIRQSAKQAFLDWLTCQSDLAEKTVMGRIGPSLDELFSEIEAELGRVAPKDLDPRFISLFLIKS